MKSVALTQALPILCIAFAPLSGQTRADNSPPDSPALIERTAQTTEAERAWTSLQQESKLRLRADSMAEQRAQPSKAELISRSRSLADRAQSFYAANPQHPGAAEARKLEVLSLIDVGQLGDERDTVRLAQRVAALRSDASVPAETRAAAVAAYEFTRALRPLKGVRERMETTVSVARRMAQEFPGEPQAYEAMLAVAKASPPAEAAQIAREVIASGAPDVLKADAQRLIERQALEGRDLAGVLGAEAMGSGQVWPASSPVIIYSWASWGPGSIQLGQMIQARGFAAIGICLDEDTTEARKLEHQAGLGGRHFYDEAGAKGRLAERLKFSTAGQIYLVDDQGVIRDVRGGDDLETKLTALGFRTPVINPTAKELRP